jgi:hypothetical protein
MGFFSDSSNPDVRVGGRELGRGACPQLLARAHGGPRWSTCDTGYPSLAAFPATARGRRALLLGLSH